MSMKKRLLSLVLCLVMVFSLLPMGSFAALPRQELKYKSVGTDWTVADVSTYTNIINANDSVDGELYYEHEGTYYKVRWDTNTVYIKASNNGSDSWRPVDVYNYPQANLRYSSDQTNFYPVSTTTGTGYVNRNNRMLNEGNLFPGGGGSWEGLHYQWMYYALNGFVRIGDNQFRRIFIRSEGNVTSLDFDGNLFYYENEDPIYPDKTVVGFVAKDVYNTFLGADTTFKAYDAHYDQNGTYGKTIIPTQNTNFSGNFVDSEGGYVEYRRGATGMGAISSSTARLKVDIYVPGDTKIRNQIYYRVGNTDTKLGETAYESTYKTFTASAANGYLYETNGTAVTRLYAVDDNGNPVSGLSTDSKYIRGDQLLNGPLYVLKSETVTAPEEYTTVDTVEEAIYAHKSLDPADGKNTYDITMDVYTTANQIKGETTYQTVDPMDVVLVIDQSGSMSTKDMDNSGSYDDVYKEHWTMEDVTGGVEYYYHDTVNDQYYPVLVGAGTVYEKENAKSVSTMFGSGHDGISLAANGAPVYYNVPTDYYVYVDANGDGTPETHKLFLITAGLFLEYGLYPYIYTDEEDPFTGQNQWTDNIYWAALISPWKASKLDKNTVWETLHSSNRVQFIDTNGQITADGDDARLSYSWFTNSKAMSNIYTASRSIAYNSLYYYSNDGVKHQLGQALLEDDSVYSGTLCTPGGNLTRTQALQKAVRKFIDAVETSAVGDPDDPNDNTDHKIAIVGFAGNRVPSRSSGETALSAANTHSTTFDYTDTGVFLNGYFKNYGQITGYQRTTDQYTNVHYYVDTDGTIDGQGSMRPVKYNTSNNQWYYADQSGYNYVSYNRNNWWEPVYDMLEIDDADYTNALVSVDSNGAVNSSITTAIDSFGAYGGTYTSYGMSMAERILANAANDGRDKYIIVFTDGEPGASGFNADIANEALAAGNVAKTTGAKIFTVGLFKNATSAKVDAFMHQLSSEYEANLTSASAATPASESNHYGLGSLDVSKTYFYQDAYGKYYAVTSGKDTLGWWIHNDSHTGTTTSYSKTTPITSTGAGGIKFYDASGRQVNAGDVRTNQVYYTSASNGDKVIYEYRWYDSDGRVRNPAPATEDVANNTWEFKELTDVTSKGGSYYMTASDATGLYAIFAEIAKTIAKTSVITGSVLDDENTYVVDEISTDFDLPADPDAAVQVYSIPALLDAQGHFQYDSKGNVLFDENNKKELRNGTKAEVTAGTKDVFYEWNGKKLTVKYYDFLRTYVAEGNEANAAELRIVINGVVANKVGDPLYSNTTQSGIYRYTDVDADGHVVDGSDSELIKPFNRPDAAVPGYSVTWYSEDASEVYDSLTDLLDGSPVAYSGVEPTKDPVNAADYTKTYLFSGWDEYIDDVFVKHVNADRDTDDMLTSFGTFDDIDGKDVVYKATFVENTHSKYTVTWMDENTQLWQQTGIPEGEKPVYEGSYPALDASGEYTYFFAGWFSAADYTAYGQGHVLPVGTTGADSRLITSFPPVTGDAVYYAMFVPVKIDVVNYVYDFSANNVIRDSGVYSVETLISNGGAFGVLPLDEDDNAQIRTKLDEAGKLLFVAENRRTEKVYDFTPLSGVNSAVYYTDAEGNKPTKVNVVAGSSVYYDDDLLGKTIAVTNGSGYSAEISTSSEELLETGAYTFTFYGTGIEVYCTTETSSGLIQAKLDNQPIKAVRNSVSSDAHTRYNVPTVTFTGLQADVQHTLKLNILGSSNYKIDGIRVYGAVAETVYAKNNVTSEQNAVYKSLRELLVNDAEAFTYRQEGTTSGVLYVDDASKIDSSSSALEFSSYLANSPKNEIYLSKGQGVAFTIENLSALDNTATITVGLSTAQNGQTANVTLGTDDTQTVSSPVDMYYTIQPIAGNVFFIQNNSDTVISLTKIKVSGNSRPVTISGAGAIVLSAAEEDVSAEAEPVELQFVVNAATMRSVEMLLSGELDAPDPTPDPTDNHGAQNWIAQLISSFVNALFRSIARLFGN